MDKNKATHKLKGIPPIYIINLDGEPHRWKEVDVEQWIKTQL